MQLGGERARERAPRLDRVGQQRVHVERLGGLRRAAPARGRVEVLEREAGAAQLELDRGDAPRGGGIGDHPVEPEQRGAQRRAQLVRGLGDERHPPLGRDAQGRDGGERSERREPADHGEGGRHRGSPIRFDER